jgi:hypothetical protein
MHTADFLLLKEHYLRMDGNGANCCGTQRPHDGRSESCCAVKLLLPRSLSERREDNKCRLLVVLRYTMFRPFSPADKHEAADTTLLRGMQTDAEVIHTAHWDNLIFVGVDKSSFYDVFCVSSSIQQPALCLSCVLGIIIFEWGKYFTEIVAFIFFFFFFVETCKYVS